MGSIIFFQLKVMAEHQNSLGFAFFPQKMHHFISRDHKRQMEQSSGGFKQEVSLRDSQVMWNNTPALLHRRRIMHIGTPLSIITSRKKAFSFMTDFSFHLRY